MLGGIERALRRAASSPGSPSVLQPPCTLRPVGGSHGAGWPQRQLVLFHPHGLLLHVPEALLGTVWSLPPRFQARRPGNGVGEEEVCCRACSGDGPALTGLPSAALRTAETL